MLIVLAALFLIGLVTLLIQKVLDNRFCCFQVISEFVLTELILTLIVFNLFNLTFSATIQLTYATGS